MWRVKNDSWLDKKRKASLFSFYFVAFLILLSTTIIKVQGYTILLMFLVYEIYNQIKIRYLPSIYQKNDNTNLEQMKPFYLIRNVDLYACILVLILYMLYNFDTFNVEKQTMYYFYSSIAQVFSALLGIVIMFGILILQTEKKSDTNSEHSIFLKNGLVGFSFLYILVIILSMLGILVVNDIIQENAISLILGTSYSAIGIQNFFNMTVFEICFLMAPVALIYLYVLVTEFLKLDSDENDKFQKMMSDF